MTKSEMETTTEGFDGSREERTCSRNTNSVGLQWFRSFRFNLGHTNRGNHKAKSHFLDWCCGQVVRCLGS